MQNTEIILAFSSGAHQLPRKTRAHQTAQLVFEIPPLCTPILPWWPGTARVAQQAAFVSPAEGSTLLIQLPRPGECKSTKQFAAGKQAAEGLCVSPPTQGLEIQRSTRHACGCPRVSLSLPQVSDRSSEALGAPSAAAGQHAQKGIGASSPVHPPNTVGARVSSNPGRSPSPSPPQLLSGLPSTASRLPTARCRLGLAAPLSHPPQLLFTPACFKGPYLQRVALRPSQRRQYRKMQQVGHRRAPRANHQQDNQRDRERGQGSSEPLRPPEQPV